MGTGNGTRDNRPQLTVVTGNAASNDAMLSINRQLGLHASATIKTWQVSTERVRAYQSARA